MMKGQQELIKKIKETNTVDYLKYFNDQELCELGYFLKHITYAYSTIHSAFFYEENLFILA